jgi:hypothetical protein
MLSRNRASAFASAILMLTTLALSGCIQIQVIDRTPPVPAPTTGAGSGEEHDLAVLAVDFDPPLEYEEIIASKKRGEGITLLVAVENTGIVTEQNVIVQVELYDGQDEKEILRQEGVIEAIAPGEIKIFHFKDANIPFSYEYHLRVQVVPVAGETWLADNQKSYDLIITQP